MKILSVRHGFTSDHSSTSYEFLAVDKPLSAEARAHVRSLSSRVQPTRRRAHFVYNVDGYDIPGGWEALLRDYYDVMYSESYDWWTLAMAFDAPAEQQEEIARYEFYGVDDLGVRASTEDSRVIVTVHCRLEAGALAGLLEGQYEEGWEEEEEGEEATFETDDGLLQLLIEIRKQLMDRDYRALHAVWEVYGAPEAEEPERPPVPTARRTGKQVVAQLRGMLGKP